MKEIINRLFRQNGLGEVVGDVTPVSGGLMHKMFKVTTGNGSYAVKCLNPEIMKRPGVLENYARAEQLERLLEEQNLPIVPALTIDGKKMLETDGRYFYVFRWQEGSITDWYHISEDQCYQAGELLGRMHAIDPKNVEPEEPETSEIDFAEYLRLAKEKNSPIGAALEENLDLLTQAQEKLNEARRMLPAMSAVSNDDMDPKNIMWHEGRAHMIDLECLDRTNPIESSLNLALQWSGTVNDSFSPENLAAFYRGYLSVYDNGFRSYDELFGIAYTWVEWLEYNIRRALGLEGSGDEIGLGEDETVRTVGRIRYLASVETEVRHVLQEIPAPDVKRFQTRDDRLCYIDLMFEGDVCGNLAQLKERELPDGYRFVMYEPGDREAWINIELSAGEVMDRTQGDECWKRYYAGREEMLPARMVFVENAFGEKVATATAFFDIHTQDTPENGQLHWVAVKSEAQGQGLSKPLITHVLKILTELGYTHVKIHTQTLTWLACKVYYDLGFRPTAESLKENRFGWKMVDLLLEGINMQSMNEKDPGYRIEMATEADREELLALYNVQHGREFCPWEEGYPGNETIDWDLEQNALYVLKKDGRIRATISLEFDEDVDALPCWDPQLEPAGSLARLGVLPEDQRKGYGRIMLQFGMEELKRRGYRGIHFLVVPANKPAVTCYSVFGFNTVGECTMFGHDFQCYEREL